MVNKTNDYKWEELENKFELLKKVKMDLADDFTISEIGDIHIKTGKQLQIKEQVIIKTFESNSKIYCLLGYPDTYRMISHMAHNDNVPIVHSKSYQEVIKRFQIQNYQLIAKLSKLLNKASPTEPLSETDITEEENLWKIVGVDSSEIKYLKRYFPDQYTDFETEYKQLISEYIRDNKLLKQSLNRIKYTFHVFELNDKKEFN